MTPTQQVIYDMLVQAAEHGDDCPSNDVLAVAAGIWSSSASGVVAKLEKQGLITLRRTRRARVVTITATGKSTRPIGPKLQDHLVAAIAEYAAEGGVLDRAHKFFGCSRKKVWAVWAQIRREMGEQAR